MFISRSLARRLERLLQQLHQAGVPAQRLVQSGIRAGLPLSKRHCVVTSYLEGQVAGLHSSVGDARAIGHTLGLLHGISDERWGAVLAMRKARKSGYWDYLYRQASRQLLRLSRFDPHYSRQRLEPVRKWLQRNGEFLGDFKNFGLTHGDLMQVNVLLQDGTAFLIDYDMMRYGHPGIELAGAYFPQFCQNSERWDALMRGYRATCPPRVFADWERHAPAFFLLAALEWGERRVQRAHRKPHATVSLPERERRHAARSCEFALRLIAACPEGRGDWSEIPKLWPVKAPGVA